MYSEEYKGRDCHWAIYTLSILLASKIQVQSQTKVDSKMNTDEAKVRERSLDSYCHLRIYYRKYDIYISTIYLALFVRFCKD